MMQPVKRKRLLCDHVELKKGSNSMSEKQRCLMLEFLSEHPNMVLDRSVGGTSNRYDRDELWRKLSTILNKCESGARKDGGGWRRSWQDLKRYESLKAKEAMTKLSSVNQTPHLELSPLQEKIAGLLNLSISDVPSNESMENSRKKNSTTSSLSGGLEFKTERQSTDNHKKPGTSLSEKTLDTEEFGLVQAIQNIADALNTRNSIEERKVKVFENLLNLYSSRNKMATPDEI